MTKPPTDENLRSLIKSLSMTTAITVAIFIIGVNSTQAPHLKLLLWPVGMLAFFVCLINLTILPYRLVHERPSGDVARVGWGLVGATGLVALGVITALLG